MSLTGALFLSCRELWGSTPAYLRLRLWCSTFWRRRPLLCWRQNWQPATHAKQVIGAARVSEPGRKPAFALRQHRAAPWIDRINDLRQEGVLMVGVRGESPGQRAAWVTGVVGTCWRWLGGLHTYQRGPSVCPASLLTRHSVFVGSQRRVSGLCICCRRGGVSGLHLGRAARAGRLCCAGDSSGCCTGAHGRRHGRPAQPARSIVAVPDAASPSSTSRAAGHCWTGHLPRTAGA